MDEEDEGTDEVNQAKEEDQPYGKGRNGHKRKKTSEMKGGKSKQNGRGRRQKDKDGGNARRPQSITGDRLLDLASCYASHQLGFVRWGGRVAQCAMGLM